VQNNYNQNQYSGLDSDSEKVNYDSNYKLSDNSLAAERFVYFLKDEVLKKNYSGLKPCLLDRLGYKSFKEDYSEDFRDEDTCKKPLLVRFFTNFKTNKSKLFYDNYKAMLLAKKDINNTAIPILEQALKTFILEENQSLKAKSIDFTHYLTRMDSLLPASKITPETIVAETIIANEDLKTIYNHYLKHPQSGIIPKKAVVDALERTEFRVFELYFAEIINQHYVNYNKSIMISQITGSQKTFSSLSCIISVCIRFISETDKEKVLVCFKEKTFDWRSINKDFDWENMENEYLIPGSFSKHEDNPLLVYTIECILIRFSEFPAFKSLAQIENIDYSCKRSKLMLAITNGVLRTNGDFCDQDSDSGSDFD
jgi:hypothetical protein